MRPKIVDIAREAGVSPATVDRVLNGRAGVSDGTVSRVSAAVKKLDYVRDLSAANLAKKRMYRMAFVIPEHGGQFQQALAAEVLDSATRAFNERTEIDLLPVSAEDPHALVRTLNTLSDSAVDGIAIMAPETPHLRDAVRQLKDSGIPVVAIISTLPNTKCDHFVGIDNIAAGKTAGVLMGRFVGQRTGKILVLSRSMQSHDSVERRSGFDDVMQKQFPHLEVLPTIEGHDNAQRIRHAINQTLQLYNDVQGIYSLSSGNQQLGDTLSQLQNADDFVVIAHELTPHNRLALETGTFDAVITQNIGHIVRSAIRVLRAKSDRLDIDRGQEKVRIEIVLKENLVALNHGD